MVPVALAAEVRALVRDRPLVPIAVLHTTRIERRLLDGDGNTLATIADDTVVGQRLADGAVQESTWREFEARTCPWRQRAADTGGRIRGDEQRWEGHGWCGVLAHLREQVDELVMHDRGARVDEPDAVHQMRVATRRLRSALATYRPLLDRERTDPVRQELKWLG
jgi:hypothetical protein